MQKSFFSRYLLFLLFGSVFVSCLGPSQRKPAREQILHCEQRLRILDSFRLYKYEYDRSRSIYRKESKEKQQVCEQLYYRYLLQIKADRKELINCINSLLADTSYGKNIMVALEYHDPVSSYFSPCSMMTQRNFLKLTRYNLNILHYDSLFTCTTEFR